MGQLAESTILSGVSGFVRAAIAAHLLVLLAPGVLAAQAMEQYPRLPSQEATSRRANELILRVRPARGDHDEEVAEIHVIDTGPGIEPEQVKRIFQPYFTTKSGGSGLGLPTSRRLVEAHGGQLSVIAEPGMGSDFVLTIPCRPNTEDEASTSS